MTKYAMLARYCHLVDDSADDQEAANRFLETIRELIATCSLDQLEPPVKPSDYEELTRMIVKDSINYSAPMTFSDEDIVKVLERMKN